MKLGTKIIVTLSAAALALVGWAVPAAIATGPNNQSDDKTNTEAYWEDEYENALKCYKASGNSGHGTVTTDAEGNPGVKLVEFNQAWDGDRWEVLIVKGGNGYNEIKLPNANEVYHAPNNASGKPADVSHWIVCKGSQETQTFTPECKSITFEFPGSTTNQHINVKISPRGVDSDKGDITLGFHNSDDSWSNPYTATYADHADWPGWAEYAVTWVQVSTEDYHWTGEINCGEPEEEEEVVDYFICEWDAANDKSVKTKVASIGENDTEWAEGIDCGPGTATYCFADGNGGFVEETVRDDADFPLGAPVDSEKCVLEEVEYDICEWNAQTDTSEKVTVPELSDGDVEWADGIDCGPSEATYCFADGNGEFVEVTVRDDGDFPLGDPVPAEDCILDQVEYTICAEGDNGWYGKTVAEEELPADYTLWTGDAADCFEEYTTYVCWEITAEDIDMRDGEPLSNGKLFDPKQEFVMEGDSFASLQDCWDIVADCGTITWFQLDEYKIKTEEDQALLEELKKNGLGWNGESAYDGHLVTNWKFEKAVGDECEEPPVYICEWDAQTDTSVKTEVEAATGDDILWTDGVDCGPGDATYCFDDGDAGFVSKTVRDDGDFPLGPPVDAENCVLDEVEYDICEWDAQTDTSVKVTVPELSDGDIEWADGIDCGPGEATYCFADGDGGFVDLTVRDDGNFPMGDPVDAENCVLVEDEYDICVWDAETETAVQTTVPELNEGDIEWVDGSECTPDEPEYICVWDEETETAVKTEVDSISPSQTPWFDGTECTEEDEVDVVVDICVVGDDDTVSKETIDESDLTEDMILWEDEMATEGCTDDFTIVLGAPPLKAPAATPVVAVATYAG